jgi:predicted Zn-dependent protease
MGLTSHRRKKKPDIILENLLDWTEKRNIHRLRGFVDATPVKSEILTSKDPNLKLAYIGACILTDKMEEALRQYTDYKSPSAMNPQEQIICALLNYATGENSTAHKMISSLSRTLPDAQVTLTLLTLHDAKGNKSADYIQERKVSGILGECAEANNLLGILRYNEGQYAKAERCFADASSLDYSSTEYLINLMRAQAALKGKEDKVDETKQALEQLTGKQLSKKQVQEYTAREEIPIPKVADPERLFKLFEKTYHKVYH